jgi:hypothetical protein
MGKFLDNHLGWILKWGIGGWLSMKWLSFGWSLLVTPFSDFDEILAFLVLMFMIFAFLALFIGLPFLLYYLLFKKGVEVVGGAAERVAATIVREQANSRQIPVTPTPPATTPPGPATPGDENPQS